MFFVGVFFVRNNNLVYFLNIYVFIFCDILKKFILYYICRNSKFKKNMRILLYPRLTRFNLTQAKASAAELILF
jgi:hypothetical protein